MVVKKKSKQEIPVWHRKAHKAYRVNRVIIFLQMIAALILTLVIWFGVARIIH